MPINIFANPAKVSIYVKICISQNRNAFAIKKLRPFNSSNLLIYISPNLYQHKVID